MRNKILIVFALSALVSFNIKAQSFDDVLKLIESNNKEIQAETKRMESNKLEYKKENFPKGPEVSYGYFPNNASVPATKETFEVTQSFQMPCYYKNQSAYSKLMMSKEEQSFSMLRQNVLSQAKTLLIDYVYLMKRISVIEKRLKFADDTYNAFLVRMEAGDANALETNKAKLNLLKVRNQENEVRTNILAVKEKLKNLNGDNDLDLSINDYPKEKLIELDSLLFDKLATDPEILYNQKAVEASERHIKVAKNLQLPEFNLGYGSETVADEKFKGFIVGFSIPLWGSKNTIQQAKIKTDFYSLNKASITEKRITETKIQFEKVNSLKESLDSYQTVLSSVNNEELLNKSLELGEISVIEYFTEMFYYYEIYDDYLRVEKQYHQALSDLYKYKL